MLLKTGGAVSIITLSELSSVFLRLHRMKTYQEVKLSSRKKLSSLRENSLD